MKASIEALFRAVLAADRAGAEAALDGIPPASIPEFGEAIKPLLNDFYDRVLRPRGTPAALQLFVGAVRAIYRGADEGDRRDLELTLLPVFSQAGLHGDFLAAMRMRRDRVLELSRAHPMTRDGTCYLAHDPVGMRIGDSAIHLSLLALAEGLGWQEKRRKVLVLPPGKPVSNRAFLGLWAEQGVEVVDDPGTAAELSLRIAEVAYPWGYMELPTRPFDLPDNLLPWAWAAWTARHGGACPALIRLDPEARERGRRALAALGLPEGAWFVALHVRQKGVHAYDEKGFTDARAAVPATYEKAVDLILAAGGWVVTLGLGTQALRPRPGVIDYAVHPAWHGDEIDLYLLEQARFMIGTASGLIWVANAFGTPMVETNHMPLDGRPGRPGDLFLPKLIRREDGRLLPFMEYWREPFHMNLTLNWLGRCGLEMVDNGPDEIAEAVAEMLDRLEDRWVAHPDDAGLARRFDRLGDFGEGMAIARVGAAFLRRYQALLN